jgi:hypothetical protein
MSSLAAVTNKTHRPNLLKEHEVKNPPRYDDLAGQSTLSGLPTGRRVLMVLICTAIALGSTLLLLTHFQH